MSDTDDMCSRKNNITSRAGDGIHYFETNRPIPDGSRIISVQMTSREYGLEKVIGYWYQIPTKLPFRDEAIRIIQQLLKYEDMDESNPIKGKAEKFLKDNNALTYYV